MKRHLSILTLGIALLPLVGVRADSTEKTRFQQSLAVPLSRAEAAQLDSLFKAEQKASANEKVLSAQSIAANKAAESATPANRPALQKKADAALALDSAAMDKVGVANGALEIFKFNKRKRLPREVSAQLPRGATTLYAGRYPMGAGGKPMIVHLWTAGRKARSGSNYAFEESPFHLDVFGNKARKWVRVTRTTYKGDSYPDAQQVSLRYLHPATKQGPVLVLVSRVYMSTLYTVVTYPKGIGVGKNTPGYVQEFSQGGVGGGKSVYDFGVDKRGMMTVVNTGSYAGSNEVKTILAWNGREYARPNAQ